MSDRKQIHDTRKQAYLDGIDRAQSELTYEILKDDAPREPVSHAMYERLCHALGHLYEDLCAHPERIPY